MAVSGWIEARERFERSEYSFADLTLANAAPYFHKYTHKSKMGLSDFLKLREKLQQAEMLVPTLMADAVVEYRDEIADLNREQLEKGETPDATPIRPAYRNPDYARKKHAKNPKPPFNTPDLIDKENYVRSIRVDVYADGFELRATDKKAGSIAAKYGAVIGLSVYSQNRMLREAILPYMLKRFRLLLP